MKDFNLIHELRLSGVSWDDIKQDIEWFSDNDRKVYVGWLLGQEEQSNGDLLKFAKQKQAIRLSRKELGIERSINNEQIRDIALHKTFTNQVLDAIKERYTHFEVRGLPTTSNTRSHIFVTTDFHYDGDTNYLETLNYVTNAIIDVIVEKDLKSIVLVELGDIVEGATLRTSQLMGIKSGMVNQVMDVADAYIKMITRLSELVHVDFISVDSSNHTQLRNLGTKQNQLVEEDLMQVFNKIVRTALPNLDMITGEDVMMNIQGFNCFFSHGHLVRSKEKYLETLQANRDIHIDYGFFGHFHHSREIDLHKGRIGEREYDKKVFYCPALNTKESGYEKDKNLSSQAGVGYYVLESGKGHVESRKLTW